MRVKWYMRVLLFFHPSIVTITHHKRKGTGLQVTTRLKECCNKQYVYEIVEDFYKLSGKHNRRARRAK